MSEAKPSINTRETFSTKTSLSRFAHQIAPYLGLCKLKVVALIVFTALVGMTKAVKTIRATTLSLQRPR